MKQNSEGAKRLKKCHETEKSVPPPYTLYERGMPEKIPLKTQNGDSS